MNFNRKIPIIQGMLTSFQFTMCLAINVYLILAAARAKHATINIIGQFSLVKTLDTTRFLNVIDHSVVLIQYIYEYDTDQLYQNKKWNALKSCIRHEFLLIQHHLVQLKFKKEEKYSKVFNLEAVSMPFLQQGVFIPGEHHHFGK